MPKAAAPAKNQEIRDLLSEASLRLKDLADNFGEQTDEAMEEASSRLMKSARKLAKLAKTQSRKFAKKAGKEAREHPVATAAAVASAAAAVIGLVVLRKSRKA